MGVADRDRVAERLFAYVDVPSVNPSLDGGPGEAALAERVAADLAWFDAGLTPTGAEGRPNVEVFLPGAEGAPLVLFEAHLDTVVPSGKAQAAATRDGGQVFGRGACDTKGSLVAMVEALELLRAVDPPQRASVLFVGAVDEEVSGLGAKAIVERHPGIDMAVVGEPTSLQAATAHKGVLRFAVTTHGVPAHSSKPHLGVNAIHRMARVLDAFERDLLPTVEEVSHPLVGSPSYNVSTISGGTALNIVPRECTIQIDRRLNPGEDASKVLAVVDAVLDRVRGDGVEVTRREPFLVTAALDTPATHPVVRALLAAREARLGEAGVPIGVTYGSDASFFAPAGIPCVVFGPGSIDQAHSDDEWVDIEETALAAEILAGLATRLVSPPV